MVDSDYENYDIDNLIIKIGDLDLSENPDTFVNLKPYPIIKDNVTWNPNITDVASTSGTKQETQIRSGWDRSAKGYAGITSLRRETHTLVESMKNEPINPFGIYLYLDCIRNTEEAIDKWETTTRIAVTVNKMDYDYKRKRYIK